VPSSRSGGRQTAAKTANVPPLLARHADSTRIQKSLKNIREINDLRMKTRRSGGRQTAGDIRPIPLLNAHAASTGRARVETFIRRLLGFLVPGSFISIRNRKPSVSDSHVFSNLELCIFNFELVVPLLAHRMARAPPPCHNPVHRATQIISLWQSEFDRGPTSLCRFFALALTLIRAYLCRILALAALRPQRRART
jgi:hypothetical protein